MAIASREEYDAAISGLKGFAAQLNEAKAAMVNAGKECQDNMSEDTHMAKANGRLSNAMKQLDDAAERAVQLAAALSDEMERIERAGSALDDE